MPGPTNIPFGDPKAVKRWSGALWIDTNQKTYFGKKFIREDDNAPIQRLTDLEKAAGDTISFDLSVQLREQPTSGDNRLEGKEEQLRFFTDTLSIDQLRHGVTAGGKMAQKRTLHNLRMTGKARLSDYFAKLIDEMLFIYLSGDRGINEDFIWAETWAGHAENPIQAPDADHLLYGGNATAKNDLDATDKMSKSLIENAVTKARMMRSADPQTANMQPMEINGEKHYVVIMNPFQEHDLRTADTTGWIEIQKAAMGAEGRNNPIFKGGLGMINNAILHSHESAIRFNDYGAGSNVAAGRALFMGRQAGAVAYGSSSGLRFSWQEGKKDHGNEKVVTGGIIIGAKKSRFNNRDFGVLSLDTAAADPNA